MEVPEEEESKQEIGNLFEKIMAENFPNLEKEIHIQVLGAQRVPNKMKPKRPTPRCQRLNTKTLKSSKRKAVIYKRAPIRLSADFSKETL